LHYRRSGSIGSFSMPKFRNSWARAIISSFSMERKRASCPLLKVTFSFLFFRAYTEA